jgi:phosphatidylserine/phosphatidylglycerophosphate/cardiolipin synthase-like enzyme
VARGFAKAIKRARSLIYLEDQYFWSIEIAKLLATELRRQPQLQLVMVVPRFPDKDGRVSGPPSRFAQQRAIDIVQAAGGDRVGIYDVQNDAGSPIYVHAKVCVIDDVWATVGSDNLNRRSWTHDSELSCAIIDSRIDQRAPRDPGGLGDQSRTFARDLRVALWAEHLGRAADDPELLDCVGATDLWRRCSTSATSPATVDTESGRRVSRIRPHVIEPVSRGNRWWASTVYRLVFDPDGRPLALRLRRRY